MTILSYALVLPLLLGGVGIAAVSAAEFRIRSLLLWRTYSPIGVSVGSISMVLALAAIISPGTVPDALLVASAVALVLAYALAYGWLSRSWAIRKTEGMSDLVRHHTLKGYRKLGFGRAYLTAILGNHPTNSPQLRGEHMTYAKREFVRSLPSPVLAPATENHIRSLVWAAVRSRDDEKDVFFSPDLSALFEEVYTDLLWFSGKLTDENIDQVVEAAETYGIDAAKHVVGGDMPAEYLAALGIEALPPRRRFWFEKEDEPV